MNRQRTFPYLQAVYFGISKLIDNFSVFFLLGAIWALIWAGIIATLFFGLMGLGIVKEVSNSIDAAQHVMANMESTGFGTLAVLFSIIGLVIMITTILFKYQLIKLGLSIYKAQPISLSNAFSIDIREFLQFTGARLLYGIKAVLGFVLFIIPGFYIACKYYFAGFSIVAHDTDSIGADTSFAAQLTNTLIWQMLFVLIIHNGYFVLPFWIIIGSFVTTIFLQPICTLTEVHLYKTLKTSVANASEQGSVVE